MVERLLVTGGCGFIGANFIRHALAMRPRIQVVNLDSLAYSGNPENLAGLEGAERYRFVRGDVCDEAAVRPLIDWCDAAVHLAAESHVDRSIQDPRPFVATNVLGTEVMLEALRRAGEADGRRRRFIYASTDEVYGPLPLGTPEAFTEDSPLRPTNPYAATKAAGDLLAQSYARQYGLDIIITRSTNNYGPWQFPEKVIPLFVTNLVDGKPVPLYGDGLHVRDWMHVLDHCEALLAVLDRAAPGAVYNIGAENQRSNLDLTRAILRAMGHEGPAAERLISRVPDRPLHDRRYALDTSAIRRDLGWRPQRTDWEASLAATVRWYVEHERWWRRVFSGEYRAGR